MGEFALLQEDHGVFYVPVQEIKSERQTCCRPPPIPLDGAFPLRSVNTSDTSRDSLWGGGRSPTDLPLSRPCQLQVASSCGPLSTPQPGPRHSQGNETVASGGPGKLVPFPSSATQKPPLNGYQPCSRNGRASRPSSQFLSGSPHFQTNQ